MNSAFISHQRLHPAAQSEGTQTWFPCLCCSPNPRTLQTTRVCVQEQIKQHKYLIQAASSIATDERKLLPYSDSWCQAATSHLLRSVLPQTGQRFQR